MTTQGRRLSVCGLLLGASSIRGGGYGHEEGNDIHHGHGPVRVYLVILVRPTLPRDVASNVDGFDVCRGCSVRVDRWRRRFVRVEMNLLKGTPEIDS